MEEEYARGRVQLALPIAALKVQVHTRRPRAMLGSRGAALCAARVLTHTPTCHVQVAEQLRALGDGLQAVKLVQVRAP